jgi:hypothetical protein
MECMRAGGRGPTQFHEKGERNACQLKSETERDRGGGGLTKKENRQQARGSDEVRQLKRREALVENRNRRELSDDPIA